MNKYIYKGPIKRFDTIVETNWIVTTYAASETKARSNLAYQYKKNNNLTAGARVSLPGKIELVQ